MKTIILLAAALGTLSTGALAADEQKAPTTAPGCTTAGLLLPAIQKIREHTRATDGHVKVFSGRGDVVLADDGASAGHIQKGEMHIRKAGGDREEVAKASADTDATRMQSQNNLKQMSLANSCK